MTKGSHRQVSSGRKSTKLYLLIITAIMLPVICVLWLLKEASKSEQEVMTNLITEAQSRALEDAEALFFQSLQDRLNQAVLVYNENRFSPLPTFFDLRKMGLAEACVFWNPLQPQSPTMNREAQMLLEAAHPILEEINSAQKANKLLVLIERDDAGTLRLESGRNVALMILILALDQYSPEETYAPTLQAHMDAILEGNRIYTMPYSQFTYFVRRYGSRAQSIPAKETVASIHMGYAVENLFMEKERNGIIPEGILVLEDIIILTDPEHTLSLLFSKKYFMEIATEMTPSIQCFNSESSNLTDYASVRRLKAPLGFASLGLLKTSSIDTGTSTRTNLYIIIGGIVLFLSSLSGGITILLIQKQNDAAQLKNDLVATVTHELKTPVASIRLLVDTLLNPSRKDLVNQTDYLQLIGKENKRLGYLIDNFLSFSRMERNKSSFDIVPIDPLQVASSAEDIFRERFNDSRFELQVSCEQNLNLIRGDPEALTTALSNLLENALKYGGNHPKIKLRVQASDPGVSFAVEDSGLGISQSDQKKIFRKFYQGKQIQPNYPGGVGLGLSIVSFIVEKHHGDIQVDSELGLGSCFTMTIPYA